MKINRLTKQEVAARLGYMSRAHFFRKKVHANEQIMTDLKKVGYTRDCRIITPNQLAILEKYFGKF